MKETNEHIAATGQASVEVQCVMCKHREWISLDKAAEPAMCSKCFSPSVAVTIKLGGKR